MIKEVVIGIFSPKGALKDCCRDGLSLFYRHINTYDYSTFNQQYESNYFIFDIDPTKVINSNTVINENINHIYNNLICFDEIAIKI